MVPNPLFPQLLDSYRAYIRHEGLDHVSLSQYCINHGVRYKNATQWMRCRGFTASSLEYEALFEKYGGDKDLVLSALKSRRPSPISIPSTERKPRIPEDKFLRSVSVTFPDRLQVSIRETTPSALSRLLDLYNHQLDISYVRSE